MKTNEQVLDLILRVMRICGAGGEGLDCHDMLFWRCDGEYAPVTLMVNCNDLFWWGCADAETITADNIQLLEDTVREAKVIIENDRVIYHEILLLFCARSRKMRPQGAYYRGLDKRLHGLFDACGPEREVGPGDPCNTPRPTEDQG